MFLIQTHFQPLPHTAFCFSRLPSSLICDLPWGRDYISLKPGSNPSSLQSQLQLHIREALAKNYILPSPLPNAKRKIILATHVDDVFVF